MAVAVYELTRKDIAELKKPRHAGPPEWSVNDKYGNVMRTEFYHPFTRPEFADAGDYDDDDDKFVLFDVLHASPILDEEISQAGFDSVLDKLDMRPLFDAVPKQSYEDMLKKIPLCEYVVIDVTYESMGDGEYDVIYDVVGFLDSSMTLREVKIEDIKV